MTSTSGPAQNPRQIQELTSGWEFRFDTDWTEKQAWQAPSSDWVSVKIPHSWNRLGEYRLDRTTATDDRRGTGWYRLAIDGRTLDPGKRHFVEFDAIGSIADVWLNGRHLGRHAGAFSRFRLELNDALEFANNNLLIVRADNSEPRPGSSTEHVIPLLGDFFIHGGIYRPARLVSVNPSHFSMTDFGGPGIYVDSRVKSNGSAILSVRAKLTNPRLHQQVEVKLVDAKGAVVATARQAIDSSSSGEVATALNLRRPHLWNGRQDPYLYRLVASLVENDMTLDAVEQQIGIRTIRFDPDNGFLLNGQHTALHGVSRHQDYLGQGWALAREDHERDMAMIAELGANTVRFAHYQHAADWFELADRYGMAVWAELPFVNKVSFADAPASPDLIANARQQMIELIRQNYNHPSVITWGIGNEVDIDLAFKRLGPKADARPLLRELNSLSHAEDSTRPTVIADCCESTPGDKADYLPILTGEADLMGYNRYFGWYYGAAGDLGLHLDVLHAKYPSVPISVSEYGAGGALTQHVEDPAAYKINAGGRPHPEEYQSWIHEQSWPQLRDRRFLWASWIWNMFDFSSRIRKEGDATDINDKGLVTFDRKVKKDAFFYYKAQWSDAPVVYITSRRWTTRSNPLTAVKVYSNAERVALTLNGKPLGEVPCIDRICRLDKVSLDPGTNIVEVAARFPAGTIRDRVEWRLKAD